MSTKRSWFRKKAGTSAASASSKAGSHVESASAVVVAEASGSSHRGASFESREFSLFVHGLDFSDQDLVVNPESFPEVRAGDILEICTSSSGGSSGPAIIRIKAVGPVKGNVSVSVSASMAELFRLRRGVIVTLKFADASTVGLLRATVSFKDYVSRSEMWRFKAESVGRVLYHSKSLSIASINVHVKDLVGASGDVNCGIITDQTKLVFRSRSAHFTLALQMSMEMWEFAEDGDLYLERAVRFLRALFDKWKHLGVTHSLTLILFTRTLIRAVVPDDGSPGTDGDADVAGVQSGTLSDGTPFEDFVQVVVSSCTVADWTSLLPAVKAELELFPARAGWGRVSPTCERVPSIARTGNLLEAVNCALDACCLRHVDRDAHRVGNHMAFVSAGTATFDVTCTLAKVTKRRMNDLGASCDLIIVSSRPMHQAPLFVIADSSSDSSRGAPLSRAKSATTVEYKLPQWLMGQYYSGSHTATTSDSFHPLPFSQVFSREGYRLSEHGCTVPVALLTVLRRMHRASNIVYRTLLSRADEAELPVSRTRRESVSLVSAPSLRRVSSSEASMASNASDQGTHAWKHVRLQLSHMEPTVAGGTDSSERRASDASVLATPLMESRMSPMMSPALDGLPSTASVSMLRLPSGVFHYSKPGMWRSEEYHKQRFEDYDKSVFSTSSSHRPLDVIYERSALVRSRIPGSSKSLYNDMSVFAQSQALNNGHDSTMEESVLSVADEVGLELVSDAKVDGTHRSISPISIRPPSLSPQASLAPAEVVVATISPRNSMSRQSMGSMPGIMLTPALSSMPSHFSSSQFAGKPMSLGALDSMGTSAASDFRPMESSAALGTAALGNSRFRLNPFQAPSASTNTWTFDRRRWAHVYLKGLTAPPTSTPTPARLEPIGIQDVNWPSLSEPAVLPITTDFLPTSARLLSEDYSRNGYSLVLTGSGSGAPATTLPRAHTESDVGRPASLPPGRLKWLFEIQHGDSLKLSSNVVDAVARMVSYRLDHEFQIVDATVASQDSLPWMRDPFSLPLCVLSVGHRVGIIATNMEQQEQLEYAWYQIKVPEGADRTVVELEHTSVFNMWEPLMQRSVPRRRSFSTSRRDFTLLQELNWNAIDVIGTQPEDYRTSSEKQDVDRIKYNHLVYLLFPVRAVLGVEPPTIVAPTDATVAVPPTTVSDVETPAAAVALKASITPADAPNCIIQFLDAVLSRQGARVGPLPAVRITTCVTSTSTQPLRTKLDAKTKTGAVETVELEYSAFVTPNAAYELRLKWVSCGVYIEELKGALTRVARRLGSVHILQVPTVSRYGMTGLDGSDPRFVASWSAPLRVNVCLAGSDVLTVCVGAEGSILPSGALLRVELAIVEKLGMVCDIFDAGKGGAKSPPTTSTDAAPVEPFARPPSDAVGQSVGPSFMCHPGWYRQYVHPNIGCCVRFDGEGVLWIPPLVLAPSGSSRDTLRVHFESFLNLCK